MKKHSLFLSIILVLVWSLTTYAAIDVSCFPKEFYARGKGKPVTVSKFFKSDHQGAGKITFINGDSNDPDAKMVTSAKIWCNGELVIEPRDLNSNVSSLIIPVTLKDGENKLEVLVDEPRGGKMSLEVTHEVDAEAGAYVSSEGLTFSVDNPNNPLHGVELVVPAGAVTEPTLITIKEPSYIPPIPDTYDAEFIVELQPDGTNFRIPVMLKIPSWGVTEKLFYTWDDKLNTWYYVSTSYNDVTNTFNLEIQHLSPYAAFDSDEDVFKPCNIIRYFLWMPNPLFNAPIIRALDTWEEELSNVIKFVQVNKEDDANLVFGISQLRYECTPCDSPPYKKCDFDIGLRSLGLPTYINFSVHPEFLADYTWSANSLSELEIRHVSIEEIALHEIGHALNLTDVFPDTCPNPLTIDYCDNTRETKCNRGYIYNPIMSRHTLVDTVKFPEIELLPHDQTRIQNLYYVAGGCPDEDFDGIPDFMDHPAIVEAFSVNLNLDKYATATYTVSDTVGLERVELWRTTNIKVNNNDYPDDNNWQPVTSKDEQGLKVFGTIIDSPPAGVWWYGIHVVDTHGTCTTERNEDCTTGESNGSPGFIPVKIVVTSGSGISFGPQQIISTNATSAREVHAEDLDGDGDFDVLSASSSGNNIAWYENLGGGVFGPQLSIADETNYANDIDVNTVDLDGDGDMDILSAIGIGCAPPCGKIAWHENLGGGVFGPQQVIATDLDGVRDSHNADLDGDGDSDVIYANSSNSENKIAWHENMGEGIFGPQRVISTIGSFLISIYTEDLDKDGDQDILSADHYPHKNPLGQAISWFENLGSGTFGPQQVISANDSLPIKVLAADLNGDGDYDVLFAASIRGIFWHENLGGGVFGSQQVIATDYNFVWDIHAEDLDGDGDFDVLSASQNDDKIAWYENLGGGIFGPQQIISDNVDYAISVYTEDLDGDGDFDVLSAGNLDNTIAWYENYLIP